MLPPATTPLTPLFLTLLALLLPLTTTTPLTPPTTNNIIAPGLPRFPAGIGLDAGNDAQLHSWACLRCAIDCTAVIAGCTVACVFPDPAQPAVCALCIAISGATSHCAECVPGCFGRGVATPDCARPAFQRCQGANGSPGICTVRGFARQLDGASGQCGGSKPDCDVSVKPVAGCR